MGTFGTFGIWYVWYELALERLALEALQFAESSVLSSHLRDKHM